MFSSQKCQVVALFVFALGNPGVSPHFLISTGPFRRGGMNNPTTTINYMCDICPPMWTKFQNNCYRFFGNATGSWQEAESFCMGSFPTPTDRYGDEEGHLVSIFTEDENDFVYAFWRSSLVSSNLLSVSGDYNAVDSMWIGLHDRDVEDTFKWSDNPYSSVRFVSWGTSQPNNYEDEQDCVVMHNMPGPGWYDRSCEDPSAPLTFMCKVDIDKY